MFPKTRAGSKGCQREAKVLNPTLGSLDTVTAPKNVLFFWTAQLFFCHRCLELCKNIALFVELDFVPQNTPHKGFNSNKFSQ